MVRVLDVHATEVTEFRKKVYEEDLGLPIFAMDLDYHQLKNMLEDDSETLENAWKMSNTKFLNSAIDKVFMVDGAISCGAVIDESRYRGGYLSYTLKRMRKKLRCFHYKEFGFITMQALRAIELKKDKLIVYIYAYNRRMKAQIRAYNHKGYSDGTEHHLHKETKFTGLETVKGVEMHTFEIDFNELKEKYEPYLMELKTPEEERSVKARFPKDVRKYPDCVPLMNISNLDELINEYKSFTEKENYLITRRKDLVISPSINALVAAYMGFRNSVYEGYPLNKRRTKELKDSVGSHTKNLLDSFKNISRPNYITTRIGWKTVEHTDHMDYTDQGFRVIVPLTGPMKMTFDSEREYILEPGKAYFVNVCIPHVGEHYSDKEERAGILFKLDDDDIIWQAYSSA